MKLKLEIIKAENGVTDSGRPWVRLSGYDLSSGRFSKTAAMEALAEAALKVLSDVVHEGEDIAERKPIIEFDGDWRYKENKRTGRKESTFWYKSFEVLSGPKMELARTQRDASRLLDEAYKIKEGGDTRSAYLKLEAFVAAVARQPAPSVKDDIEAEATNAGSELGIEEEALARFARLDRARGDAPAAPAAVEAAPDPAEAAMDYITAKEGLDAGAPEAVVAGPEPTAEISEDQVAAEVVLEASQAPEADAPPAVEAAVEATDADTVEAKVDDVASEAAATAGTGEDAPAEEPSAIADAAPETVAAETTPETVVPEAVAAEAVTPKVSAPPRPAARPAPPSRMAPPMRPPAAARPAAAPSSPAAPKSVAPTRVAAPEPAPETRPAQGAPAPRPMPRPSPMMRAVPGRVPARPVPQPEPEQSSEPGMKM